MKQTYFNFLLATALLTLSTLLSAQSSGLRFEMASEPGIAKNGQTITLSLTSEGVELFMNLVNISDDDMDVQWERVRISRSNTSITDQLCDNLLCHDLANAGDFWLMPGVFNLPAGGQTLFQPKMITPTGTGGNATMTYYVRNMDNDRIDSITVVFTSTASIKNESGVTNSKVYPNPSTGVITVKDVPAGAEIEVTDMVGKLVFKSKLSGATQHFDLSKNPDGVYFYTIRAADGQSVITKRLVLRK
jgi:hypothetical protein